MGPKIKKTRKTKKHGTILTEEIIKQRFGTVPKRKLKFGEKIDKAFFKHETVTVQNFDSVVNTSTKDEVVGKFILSDSNKNNQNSEQNAIQMNMSKYSSTFPPLFASEIDFLTWLHFTSESSNETQIFERNPLTWLQFHIAVSQSEVLLQILDWRELDFYFEPDLLNLNKKIVCVLGKVDLCDDTAGLCAFLNKCNKLLNYDSKLSSDCTQFVNNPKYKNLIGKIEVLSSQGILFFPFSSVIDECNVQFMNFIDQTHHNSFAMIGYPNVGKSTFLKYLTKNEKIKISGTPGKTKYCQQYKIVDKENLDLNSQTSKTNKIFHDVPGLTFKRHSTESLIINNVVNVDQIRINYENLLDLLLQKVKLSDIFKFYKFDMNLLQKKEKKVVKKSGVNFKRAFFQEQRELLFGLNDVVEDDTPLIRTLDELDNNSESTEIFLDKLKNTVKKLKHWTIEVFFRKVIKDLFDGKISRHNF